MTSVASCCDVILRNALMLDVIGRQTTCAAWKGGSEIRLFMSQLLPAIPDAKPAAVGCSARRSPEGWARIGYAQTGRCKRLEARIRRRRQSCRTPVRRQLEADITARHRMEIPPFYVQRPLTADVANRWTPSSRKMHHHMTKPTISHRTWVPTRGVGLGFTRS